MEVQSLNRLVAVLEKLNHNAARIAAALEGKSPPAAKDESEADELDSGFRISPGERHNLFDR